VFKLVYFGNHLNKDDSGIFLLARQNVSQRLFVLWRIMVNRAQCPFVAGPKLVDPNTFVGRSEQIKGIIRHMTGSQAVSVNVVGDRRIGKSSLLQHICDIYTSKVVQEPYCRKANEFMVVYLSLKDARCANPDGFYRSVVAKLLELTVVQTNDALRDALQSMPNGPVAFDESLQACEKAGMLPVVCLDDFEELLDHQTPFTDDFFDNMRPLVEHSRLMLIVASRESLKHNKKKYRYSSDFFNVFQTYKLSVFSNEEATNLLQLPASTNPALDEDRRKLARQWAGDHPYKLQLAASILWETERLDEVGIHEAQERFKYEAVGVKKKVNVWKKINQGVRGVGRHAKKIGKGTDDVGNFVQGSVIVIVVLLCVGGAMKWQDALGFVQTTITNIAGSLAPKEKPSSSPAPMPTSSAVVKKTPISPSPTPAGK
jgi:uncharacterized protein